MLEVGKHTFSKRRIMKKANHRSDILNQCGCIICMNDKFPVTIVLLPITLKWYLCSPISLFMFFVLQLSWLFLSATYILILGLIQRPFLGIIPAILRLILLPMDVYNCLCLFGPIEIWLPDTRPPMVFSPLIAGCLSGSLKSWGTLSSKHVSL